MDDLVLSVRTMDSREIAELTKKNHADVCRDIKTQLGQLEGGVSRFADTYRNLQNGQDYPCFKLPYRETMILVSGYRVDLRAKIIDRWIELERRPQVAAVQPLQLPRLTAALAHEMRLMFGYTEAQKRVDYLIGYKSEPAVPTIGNEVLQITSDIGRISKQAYAVEMKQRSKLDAKAADDKLQKSLDL